MRILSADQTTALLSFQKALLSFQKALPSAPVLFDDEAEVARILSAIDTSKIDKEVRKVILELCRNKNGEALFPLNLGQLHKYYFFAGKPIDDLRLELKSLRHNAEQALEVREKKPSTLSSLPKIFSTSSDLPREEFDNVVKSLAEIEGRALLCRDRALYDATRNLRLAVIEISQAHDSGIGSPLTTERNSSEIYELLYQDAGYLHEEVDEASQSGYLNIYEEQSIKSSEPSEKSEKSTLSSNYKILKENLRQSSFHRASLALNDDPSNKEFTYDDLIKFFKAEEIYINRIIRLEFVFKDKSPFGFYSCEELLSKSQDDTIKDREINLGTVKEAYEMYKSRHIKSLEEYDAASNLLEKNRAMNRCLYDLTSLIILDLLLFHLDSKNQETHLSNAQKNIDIFHEHLSDTVDVLADKHDFITYIETEPLVAKQVGILFRAYTTTSITDAVSLFQAAEDNWDLFRNLSSTIFKENFAILAATIEKHDQAVKNNNLDAQILFLEEALNHQAAMIVAQCLIYAFEDEKTDEKTFSQREFIALFRKTKVTLEEKKQLQQSLLEEAASDLLDEVISEDAAEILQEERAETLQKDALEKCRESKDKFLQELGSEGIFGLLKELHPQKKEKGIFSFFGKRQRQMEYEQSISEKAAKIGEILDNGGEILGSTEPLNDKQLDYLKRGAQELEEIAFGELQFFTASQSLKNLMNFCDNLGTLARVIETLKLEIDDSYSVTKKPITFRTQTSQLDQTTYETNTKGPTLT
jgi:hypothetical protein